MGTLEWVPEDLEPTEVKAAQFEGHACAMHQQGLQQGWGKCTEVQHAPHAGHHENFALCILQSLSPSNLLREWTHGI